LSRICHASSPSTIRPEARASASSPGGQPLPASISPEPTGRWRMTNRFGIYLCRGSCWIKEFVGGQLALSWRSLPAVSRLSYWCCYDRGRIRIISWRRGSSADFLASRTVAWDSSLSANASKVLSTRALLPIAPRRHSAASTLSNSGEYILSIWPLLRLG
jgi:hypothetical protein